MGCQLVDLGSGVLPIITANLGRSLDEQIAAWQMFCNAQMPGLLDKLCREYATEPGGWQKIARERIWPHLSERMAAMECANRNIRATYSGICHRASRELGLGDPLLILSYVGIGNGAGWATRWNGGLAVFLGLENVAELGWESPASIEKLISHEIGHLFMMSVREDVENLTLDPLLALYEEGFAQHCEHVILGRETWGCSSQPGWLEWCSRHERHLAQEYLRQMHDPQAWRRFYGSWYDVEGWRQTAYFMGCRMVQRMAASMGLRTLASLDEERIKSAAIDYLNSAG